MEDCKTLPGIEGCQICWAKLCWGHGGRGAGLFISPSGTWCEHCEHERYLIMKHHEVLETFGNRCRTTALQTEQYGAIIMHSYAHRNKAKQGKTNEHKFGKHHIHMHHRCHNTSQGLHTSREYCSLNFPVSWPRLPRSSRWIIPFPWVSASSWETACTACLTKVQTFEKGMATQAKVQMFTSPAENWTGQNTKTTLLFKAPNSAILICWRCHRKPLDAHTCNYTVPSYSYLLPRNTNNLLSCHEVVLDLTDLPVEANLFCFEACDLSVFRCGLVRRKRMIR